MFSKFFLSFFSFFASTISLGVIFHTLTNFPLTVHQHPYFMPWQIYCVTKKKMKKNKKNYVTMTMENQKTVSQPYFRQGWCYYSQTLFKLIDVPKNNNNHHHHKRQQTEISMKINVCVCVYIKNRFPFGLSDLYFFSP